MARLRRSAGGEIIVSSCSASNVGELCFLSRFRKSSGLSKIGERVGSVCIINGLFSNVSASSGSKVASAAVGGRVACCSSYSRHYCLSTTCSSSFDGR